MRQAGLNYRHYKENERKSKSHILKRDKNGTNQEWKETNKKKDNRKQIHKE
jgi:hypothetical protein